MDRASVSEGQIPRAFIKRVLVCLGLAALVVALLASLSLAWTAALTLFGGALFGVLLDGISTRVSGWTKIPRGVVLATVLLAFIGLSVGAFVWLGPMIAERAGAAQDQFVSAWDQVRAWLEDRAWGQTLITELGKLELGTLLSGRFGGVIGSTAGTIASLALMVVLGVYFAFDPPLYIRGMAYLVPARIRPRVHEVCASIGQALRSWLLGRFMMMAVVGAGTSLGLWAVGVPLAVPLGVFAGLMSFVPNLGPLLAMLPGLLLGLSVDVETTLWAAGVYIGVQLIEGYAITPLIQLRAVSMPPALLIGFQLLMGLSAGVIGLFMATPLLVTIVVVVQVVYLRGILGDEIDLIGGREAEDEDEAPEQLELGLA